MTFLSGAIQRHQPLQVQAYQALKAAILSGDFAPNERLVETKLAVKLNVSRTPIREALRLLQHEDLVVAGTNGVLYVASFTPDDARQLYGCRIALERQAVSDACEHATKEDLQMLDRILEKSQHVKESKPTALTTFQRLDLDYQFHRLIAQSSRNLWLASLLDRVFDKMQLLRIQTTQCNPDVLEICVEHREIYEAIARRNATAAIETVQAHLSASRERVVQEIQQFQRHAN